MHVTNKQPRPSVEIGSIMDKEYDVKVCDICGDAGQEDLLAICSGCVDGAEHIYCMQTMLDKLPVGDWLCEVCKFKEEYKNNKAHKLDTVTKIQEGAQNTSSAVYSEILLKEHGAVINLEDMLVCSRPQVPEVYDVNVDLNIHICAKASIKSPVATETSISREVLFSSEDSCEEQKAHMSRGSNSFAGRDGFEVVSGPLVKSSSFKSTKSKPEVKQLLGAAPLAENVPGKHVTISTVKGGLTRETVKFASFNTETGDCNSFKLGNEKSSVSIIQMEDLSVKRDKELCVTERRNSSKVNSDSRICRGLVDKDNSGHDRESPLHSSRSSASASSNGLYLEYQNQCQVPRGFRSRVNVSNRYRKPGCDPLNPHLDSQHDNHLNQGPSHQDDIIRAITSSSTLDKPIYISGRACQKCNGGHPTHLCSIDKYHVSAIKLSVDRMSRENVTESNKCKSASETILSEQEESKCTVSADHSKELSVPSIPKASVIPRLEFFWQGDFEVLRSGRLPEHCDGLQAHFSSYASSKVFEAAKEFPPGKVQLEEVPCLSSWPQHFHGNHATDNNIALFFFAKDTQSYQSSYCKLLDNMLKYDLALKGNFGGFELLIFPSYKLSRNSQRWNRLLFLWGIFKGRRSSSIEMN